MIYHFSTLRGSGFYQLLNFCTFCRLKFTKSTKFRVLKIAKYATFRTSRFSKMISRKIWVIKFWNIHMLFKVSKLQISLPRSVCMYLFQLSWQKLAIVTFQDGLEDCWELLIWHVGSPNFTFVATVEKTAASFPLKITEISSTFWPYFGLFWAIFCSKLIRDYSWRSKGD